MSQLKQVTEDDVRRIRNEDPVTGQPGAHLLGTGIGTAIGGIAAGAAAGSVVGPIGTVAGAVLGGVTGGLVGKAIAENMDPTLEIDYWRGAYHTRPYFDQHVPFETIEPAYRMGAEAFEPGFDWEEIEPDLQEKWDHTYASDSAVKWERARLAARDAYARRRQLADTVECCD